MNEKEKYLKKVEILKKWLESGGDIEALKKAQGENKEVLFKSKEKDELQEPPKSTKKR